MIPAAQGCSKMVQDMSYSELEYLRLELGLGVNAFLKVTTLPKSSYYRQKRAARRAAKATQQEALQQAVRTLCEQHPCLGYRPIHALLCKHRPELRCSASTIYRVMKALDLCQKPVKKRLVKSAPAPLNIDQLGMTVGLDFTHWQKQPICNVLEYESRYCLASVVSLRETSEAAKAALKRALDEAASLGLPSTKVEVKSDHGSPFTAEPFTNFLSEQRCQQALSAVGKPQGMGSVERLNRSIKEQGLAREETLSPLEIQEVLDNYRNYYNTQRPHQALGSKTPIQVIRQSTHFQAKLVPAT
jgi:putative transposase